MQLKTDAAATANRQASSPNRDELYEAAVDVVIREGRGSVSLLQRALGIGYGRAARLIDFMAEDGIVGQYNGSQAREVLDDHRAVGRDERPSLPRRSASRACAAGQSLGQGPDCGGALHASDRR